MRNVALGHVPDKRYMNKGVIIFWELCGRLVQYICKGIDSSNGRDRESFQASDSR